MPNPSGYYTSCPQFWIRQTTGDDGRRTPDDPSRAWKTFGRLRHALGPNGLFRGDRDVTITIDEDNSHTPGLPSGDPLVVDFGINDPTLAKKIVIVSPPQTFGSAATVSTYRQRRADAPGAHDSLGSNDPNGIFTSVGAGFDWSPYIATDVVLLGQSGGLANKLAFVAMNEGDEPGTPGSGTAGEGRISSIVDMTSLLETASVAGGDTFIAARLARVDRCILNQPIGTVWIRGMVFTQPTSVFQRFRGASSIAFIECSQEQSWGALASLLTFLNCRQEQHFTPTASVVTVAFGIGSNLMTPGTGGSWRVQNGSFLTLQSGWIGQFFGVQADFGSGLVSVLNAGLFGNAGPPGTNIGNGIGLSRYAKGIIHGLWGRSGPGAPLICDPGCHVTIPSNDSNTCQGNLGNYGFAGDPQTQLYLRQANDHSSNSIATWSQTRKGMYNWMGTGTNVGPQA